MRVVHDYWRFDMMFREVGDSPLQQELTRISIENLNTQYGKDVQG